MYFYKSITTGISYPSMNISRSRYCFILFNNPTRFRLFGGFDKKNACPGLQISRREAEGRQPAPCPRDGVVRVRVEWVRAAGPRASPPSPHRGPPARRFPLETVPTACLLPEWVEARRALARPGLLRRPILYPAARTHLRRPRAIAHKGGLESLLSFKTLAINT